MPREARNALGGPLEPCCNDPVTGFYRDGYCNTGANDLGVHTVCAVVTDEFLLYSKDMGNDLMTPNPAFGFQGLKAGDKWCLCVSRWEEARKVGKAPKLLLKSTHEVTTEFVELSVLKEYALDAET